MAEQVSKLMLHDALSVSEMAERDLVALKKDMEFW